MPIFMWYVAICGHPPSPKNGYIVPYTSTVEGARVMTMCTSDSLGLGENITSVSYCGPQGDWVPNPINICVGAFSSYISYKACFDFHDYI